MSRFLTNCFVFALLCMPGWIGQVHAQKGKKAKKTTAKAGAAFEPVWKLLVKHKCNVCHRPTQIKKGKGKEIEPPSGLNMSTKKLAYKNLVGAPSKQARKGIMRVNNNKGYTGALRVAYSYLVYKLLGNHKDSLKGKGLQMPPISHRMSHDEVRQGIDWIVDGAKY